jgi:hypothetical protein
MISFDSSSIAAGGYDSGEGILRLRYIDGDTYDYLKVPRSVFRALLEAPSKGRFVNWHVNVFRVQANGQKRLSRICAIRPASMSCADSRYSSGDGR